jgi:hypothetical protein
LSNVWFVDPTAVIGNTYGRVLILMAKEIITRLRDDLDGSEATTTVAFAWSGVAYEIDLNDANFEKFSASIAPYVAAARKVAAPGRGRGAQGSTVDRHRLDAIRSWAKAAGLSVADRGRIRASIIAAYDDAQAALAMTGAAPRMPPSTKKPAAKKTGTPSKAAAERRRIRESIVEAYDDAQAALAKTGAAPRMTPRPRKAPTKSS